jgi:predicted phage tail protein
MRAVKVYGQLAKRVGQNVFRADVASPAEAIRFLCSNFPGLDEWLIDSAKDGIGYRVMVGRTRVQQEDFVMTCSDDATVSITPVLCGAGGGAGQIFAGIGLIAAAILLAPLGGGFLGLGAGAGTFGAAGAGFTLGATASSAIGFIGASLVLGGVSQMISPSAQAVGGGAASDPRRLQSFNFSGIQNTSFQGTPINIAYGKILVGSTTLSAGIYSTNMV